MSAPELVVTAGVHCRGTKVLIARRAEPASDGAAWELPGGKVEPGESLPACLQREWREELGVDITVGPAFGESCWTSDERQLRLVALVVNSVHGEPQPTVHTDVRYADIATLDERTFLPADRPLIAQLKAQTGC
jgi:mutator protein MutT